MCTASVARAVSTSISVSRDWKPTHGKAFLWHLVMSLVTDVKDFRQHTCDVGFLTYDVIFLKVRAGLALYTVNKLQVNVNILVPVDPQSSVHLVREVEQYISGIYADHTINLVPLRTHIPELSIAEFVKRRRFVPSRVYISKLSVVDYDRRIIRCCEHDIIALRRIECKHEVAKYRPLSTMCSTDDLETTYWHKFECGAIFAFTNPLADMVESVPFPPPFCKGSVISRHMDDTICKFVYALHPFRMTETTFIVEQRWMPPNIREICVCSAISTFGITDELVISVGENIFDTPSSSGFMSELIYVFKLVQTTMMVSDKCMCVMMATMMRKLDDNPVWRKWICESTLLWTCIMRIPCSLLDTLLRRSDMELFRTMCIRLLHHRIGMWTPDEKERVSILYRVVRECLTLPPRKCAVEMDAIRQAFESLNATANVALDVLANEISTVPVAEVARSNRKKCKKKLPRSQASRPDSIPGSKLTSLPNPSADVNKDVVVQIRVPLYKNVEPQCAAQSGCNLSGASSTHVPIVQKMRRQFPSLHIDLIGSGIFSNTGDVDIVVTVSGHMTATSDSTTSPSLSEAYEYVRSVTGWSPKYHKVDGVHVSVLSGTFDGVAVDAQVWRGEVRVLTRSEVLTREAIDFARKLSAEAGVEALAAARWMHEWTEAAGLKGHKLCRLPGIGVTCAAIALTCGSQRWTCRSLLSSMRECLSSDMPLIDFDSLRVSADTVATRCTVPLTIMVNERNCCSRMTAATTKHMVDVLAYALERGVDLGICDKSVYSEWRRHNMVVCARARPRTHASISYSLLSVAASLERHPIIDTLYFSNDDDDDYEREAKDDFRRGAQQVQVREDENDLVTAKEVFDNNNGDRTNTCREARPRHAWDSSCITVMCTLRADADVDIYGFRRDDLIRCVGPSAIIVDRQGRTFTLALSRRRATKCCVQSATRICDMLSVNGVPEDMSFPNAVFLTCDVSALFDAALWESCLSTTS